MFNQNFSALLPNFLMDEFEYFFIPVNINIRVLLKDLT